MLNLSDKTKLLAAPIVALSLALPASAQDLDEHRAGTVTLEVTTIAGNLEHPWSVEVLPDGAYVVTERPGRMRIIRDGKVGEPLRGLPKFAATGQGGLLDVALAPDFAETRRLFFTAAAPARADRAQLSFQPVSATTSSASKGSTASS